MWTSRRGFWQCCAALCGAFVFSYLTGCVIRGDGRYGRGDGSVPGSDGCDLTSECGEGSYCSYGRQCQPAGSGNLGIGCDTTADCEAGLVCAINGLTALCSTPGTAASGEACRTTSDCVAGLVCPSSQQDDVSCSSPNPSDNPEPGPRTSVWGGETCPADSSDPIAYFDVPAEGDPDVDFFRLPFPNDGRRRTDGTLDLSGYPNPGEGDAAGVVSRYISALESDATGFSRFPVVTFRFSKPLNYDSLNSAITLVNITAGTDSYDQPISFQWSAVNGRTTRYICSNWLSVRPAQGRPLRGGDTFAVLINSAAADREGNQYSRSPDFDLMFGSTVPTDPNLARAYQAYAPLRHWITDTRADANSIVNAVVFTVQEDRRLIPRLREAVRSGDAPQVSDLTLCDGSQPSPCESDEEGQARSCGAVHEAFHELHGRLSLPIFQEGQAPYFNADDKGGIPLTGDAPPTAVRREDVCFSLAIPKVPTPTGGFPLVVYGHGTGGSFRSAMENLAPPLAQARLDDEAFPIATMGLDLPQHGDRRGESAQSPDVLFFNFGNPQAAKGNVAQGAADLMSLVYWAESFSLDEATSPLGQALSFDNGSLALFGHSQGATHGALILPFETSLVGAILSGVGGHVTSSLLGKVNPINIAAALPIALADPERSGGLASGAHHPALALIQTYFDDVDPLNYGPLLTDATTPDSGLHLFMTYGLGDTYTPKTQQTYARSASLALLRPVLTTNDDGEPQTFGLSATDMLQANRPKNGVTWTQGMRQYSPADGDDGHFVATKTSQGQADTVSFLVQALSGSAPALGR